MQSPEFIYGEPFGSELRAELLAESIEGGRF